MTHNQSHSEPPGVFGLFFRRDRWWLRKRLPMVRDEHVAPILDKLRRNRKGAKQYAYGSFITTLGMMLLFQLGFQYIHLQHGWSMTAIALILTISIPLIGLSMIIYRKRLAVVWSIARDYGYDVCAKCGYDLRDIESQHCPECGTAVTPEPAE